MTRQRLSLGKKGEELACRFLRGKGYTIVQRNYRGRSGEIDIVARDGACLVFVEVKTRSDQRFGTPFEALTPRKQAKLHRVALEYLGEHGGVDQHCRIDVVGVAAGDETKVELLQNAFDVAGGP